MNPLDKGKQMPCLRHVLNIFLFDIFSMIVRSPKLIENCQKRGHQYAKHCMHVMKKNLLTNYSAVSLHCELYSSIYIPTLTDIQCLLLRAI